MSFIPGLSEELAKAWDGTVGTVSRAGAAVNDAVSDTWNWLTGKPRPANAETPVANNLENESEGVSEVAPLQDQERWWDHSLGHLLNLLRIEAMHNCEVRTRAPLNKATIAQQKSKTLNELLGIINVQSDSKGNFDAKDQSTKDTIEECRKIGVKIPVKDVFTKEERDSIVTNINTLSKGIDVDLKLAINEAQEAMQQRNTFWQELKSCWDKISEAIRKFIQGIASR
ncbi:MAG: hypothetical protein LLF94_10420 [Chlamydiales bacterium]|nr:hypothetical protein [Chlamydiales bacterium]